MGVKYFSFIGKFNFDSYTGKFTIRFEKFNFGSYTGKFTIRYNL